MCKLRPDLILGFNSLGPRDDERIGRTTSVGFALPAAEWRVARESPTPWEVIEVFGPANFVDRRQVLLDGVRNI